MIVLNRGAIWLAAAQLRNSFRPLSNIGPKKITLVLDTDFSCELRTQKWQERNRRRQNRGFHRLLGSFLPALETKAFDRFSRGTNQITVVGTAVAKCQTHPGSCGVANRSRMSYLIRQWARNLFP